MTTLAAKLAEVFRENLAHHMEQSGHNQSSLARIMRVTPSYISQVLSGHRGVALEGVENFANALKVKPEQLLKKFQKAV